MTDSNNGNDNAHALDANSLLRSLHFSAIIGHRPDEGIVKVICEHSDDLVFEPIEELMISQVAWDHVRTICDLPSFVFAHPNLIKSHPTVSEHYRGIALLSQKQVQHATRVQVARWKDEAFKSRVGDLRALAVARLYNMVISSIIEASTNWTLENGHRNILATMGVTLDGSFRNKIGMMAEALVRRRILRWLRDNELTTLDDPEDGNYPLPNNTIMRFGSEPDILFSRDGIPKATIEIKGGTDPAGALERLGAMDKSFKETPIDCDNFLIAGVITEEMSKRLRLMRVKAFRLEEISRNGEHWNKFVEEVFHYSLRVV